MSTQVEVRERPILFSGPMVRAILEGRKTQTRRVVTDHTSRGNYRASQMALGSAWIDSGPSPTGNPGPYLKAPTIPDPDCIERLYPWVFAGDRLYVRECFSYERGQGRMDRGAVWFWADGNPPDGDWTRPKPSIHMPRWASRITLEVTAVRVERLHEITEADAIAEGARTTPEFPASLSNRSAFGKRWDALNAKRGYGWAENPFVWVIEFRVVSDD